LSANQYLQNDTDNVIGLFITIVNNRTYYLVYQLKADKSARE